MTPGSPAAKVLGCNCPYNNAGCGETTYDGLGPLYAVNGTCMVHGMSKWTIPRDNNLNISGAVTMMVVGKGSSR